MQPVSEPSGAPEGIGVQSLVAATCARLYPHEAVLQRTCVRSCADASGDGQDCAFAFSRSLRVVPAPQEDHSALIGTALLAPFAVLILWAAGRWLQRHRRRGRGLP